MSLFRVIPKSKIGFLSSWSYNGSAPMWVDRVLMAPWWEFVTSLMPRWLAPNTITLAGNSMNTLALLLTLVYVPDLLSPAPRWVYFVLPLLNFLWQTLDAVDGKQARRTNNQSPLGCLFDHGLDGFTWPHYFVPVVATLQFGIGTQYFMWFFCGLCWLVYVNYWATRYTGLLLWDGTTSQFLVMLLYLAVGVFGGDWLHHVIELPDPRAGGSTVPLCEVQTAILVLGLFGPVTAAAKQFVDVCGRYRSGNLHNNISGAFRELAAGAAVYVCLCPLFASAVATSHFPLVFAAFNLGMSHLINKTIVYEAAHMDAEDVEWTVVPAAVVAATAVVAPAHTVAMLWAYTAVMSLVWLRFVVCACSEICTELNIRMFVVKPYAP